MIPSDARHLPPPAAPPQGCGPLGEEGGPVYDPPMPRPPVRLAIVNDYAVVVRGLHAMLAPFDARVDVRELDSQTETLREVDVTLFDAFGRARADDGIEKVLSDPRNGRVVVYSWHVDPALVQEALDRGCAGYLDKASTPEELVAAVERVAAGERVTPTSVTESPEAATRGSWPGQEHGLSAREAEVLGLITLGLTNEEIGRRTYLSPNTVKTYIRNAYQKIGVTRRPQAVRWGMEHGLLPEPERRQP